MSDQPPPGSPQQPQATPPMIVGGGGGGDRNANNLSIGPNGRPWTFGLFDFFADARTCITACFCPCIVYDRVYRRQHHLARYGTPSPDVEDKLLSGECLCHAFLLFGGCSWMMQGTLRSDVRQRYNIEGNSLTDSLTSCFCSACQLTQESREIELEEKSFGGAEA